MSKCQCGAELQPPGMWVGYNEYHVPMAILHCKGCGGIIPVQIESMVPYVAARCEIFPPARGEYQIAPAGNVNFTCPVCNKTHGLGAPVHTIGANGQVAPSLVCPYGCGFHVWLTLSAWPIESVRT